MKNYLKGFIASLGMFSILPVPHLYWSEEVVAKIIPTFPLVGLVLGLLWWGIGVFLQYADLPYALTVALLGLFIPICSGFIHLDGYMDTADAILSRRPERSDRRRILKDPTTGCFAVVALGVYLVLWLSGIAGFLERGLPLALLGILPMIARTVGGTALIALPSISSEGYGASFRRKLSVGSFVLPAVAMISGLWAGFEIGGTLALVGLLGGVLVGLGTAWVCYHNLQGFSGDLAGCTIIMTELWGMVFLACFWR